MIWSEETLSFGQNNFFFLIHALELQTNQSWVWTKFMIFNVRVIQMNLSTVCIFSQSRSHLKKQKKKTERHHVSLGFGLNVNLTGANQLGASVFKRVISYFDFKTVASGKAVSYSATTKAALISEHVSVSTKVQICSEKFHEITLWLFKMICLTISAQWFSIQFRNDCDWTMLKLSSYSSPQTHKRTPKRK